MTVGWEITVDDTPVDPKVHQVLQLRVERLPDAPSAATVIFSDVGYTMTPKVKVGSILKVKMAQDGALTPQFHGEVVELSLDERERSKPELRVDALDQSHRLALGTAVKSFTNQDITQVLTTLTEDVGTVQAPGSVSGEVAYLLQASSPMAMLTELVHRFGCTWRFDAVAEAPKFVVEEPTPRPAPDAAVKLELGKNLFSFTARHNGRAIQKASVRGWDVSTSEAIDEEVTGAEPNMGPFESTADWSGAAEVVISGTPVLDTGEAKAVAEAVIARAAAQAVTVRGVARFNPAITPGAWVHVTGGVPQSSVYHVDRVVHTYDHDGGTTRFEGGDAPLARAPELGTAGLASAGPASNLRLDSLVVGMVSDNDDPDGLGRVKVKFPWLSEEHGSHWARVVTFGAGQGPRASEARGAVFLPEIDDEVIVGFENGDLRRPVVLGTVYNAQTKVPKLHPTGGHADVRSITSRNGHTIAFSDKSGADSHVNIQLAGNRTFLKLTDDGVELEAEQSKPLSIKAGQASLTFDDKGNITLKGQKITIDGTELAIKGTQKVGLTAPAGSITLESGGAIKLSGINTEVAGTASLKASGGTVSIN
jgi:hypothetical protein